MWKFWRPLKNTCKWVLNQDVSRQSFQKDRLCTELVLGRSYTGARLRVHFSMPVTHWEQPGQWLTATLSGVLRRKTGPGPGAFLSLQRTRLCLLCLKAGYWKHVPAWAAGAGACLRGSISKEKEEATCVCLVLDQVFQRRRVNSEVKVVT